MLVEKNNDYYIDNSAKPNENWLGSNFYLVDSNSEMADIIRNNFPKIEIVVENNVVVDVVVLADTIEEVVAKKVESLSEACSSIIYDGLDITLSGGETEHFTLDEHDQLNLSGLALKLIGGAEMIAWHENNETIPCRWYYALDGWTIINTLTAFKEYHITYFRDLRIYVNSLTSVEEIKSIQYGFKLPDDAKSDVLKVYEQQLGVVT